ncbi:fucose mutarotase isoform X2 [Megalops cyprinoides]|uniref:fucose mutarotase isoform X2 n=1 Tax=Megalops cyprinoides TaxID=118141 RepID=UPI00186438E9|nr:fucose mutarotase isoform X2 [Megalops cyprinoides]
MVVLKGIPSILSPELLYTLAKMGHGDELVLADTNFPTSSTCRCGPNEIRADGVGIPELLEAILKLFPLDSFVDSPLVSGITPMENSECQRAALQKPLERVERFAFYERAKKSFAVVATGEASLYGNLIIKKGVIPPEDLC